VIFDKRTGESKGFGFVNFVSAADAAQALQQLNGQQVRSVNNPPPLSFRRALWHSHALKTHARTHTHTHTHVTLPCS
jgi:RNA recognition motif-containing protein